MGNCWTSDPAVDHSIPAAAATSKSNSINHNYNSNSTTPGTSKNFSNEEGAGSQLSGTGTGTGTTSSSAGNSRFWAAASGNLEEEEEEDAEEANSAKPAANSCANSASASGGEFLAAPNLKTYAFAELKSVTKGFKADSVLGVGGFGTVYRGWVDQRTLAPSKFGTGMLVAIKKLNPESVQGLQEWQSEVNFLGSASHPNLVKLLGYCKEDKELLLVYEYMPKGSLENHLFGRSSVNASLPWDRRLKIAIDAARGLAFLHTSDKQVIYRDFKASNILLDANYSAKLSDFGLAKLGPSGEETHVTTRIMGTYGYAAPEYMATGHLYVKSDVYGFGVVLLELLTGLRAVDVRRPSGEQNLVEWMRPLLPHRRKVKTIVDGKMKGQYPSKAAFCLGELALKCLLSDPRRRPSMKEVTEALEKIDAMSR